MPGGPARSMRVGVRLRRYGSGCAALHAPRLELILHPLRRDALLHHVYRACFGEGALRVSLRAICSLGSPSCVLCEMACVAGSVGCKCVGGSALAGLVQFFAHRRIRGYVVCVFAKCSPPRHLHLFAA